MNANLLFFGDCMFGRQNNQFIKNPFVNVEKYIKDANFIFFNLETVISPDYIDEKYKEPKTFNFQSNGEQLLELKKITKGEIYASTVNNHIFDYGYKGFNSTIKFLKNNNIKTCTESSKFITFLCASDHPVEWSDKIWIFKNSNKDYETVKKFKNKNKLFIFSIHWGPNWLFEPDLIKMKKIGRKLIDSGVNIVFGHSAHHIPNEPYEIYNGGLIIYGLGDFINDYSVDKQYKSDEALMLQINQGTINPIKIKRKFINQGSSIPFKI